MIATDAPRWLARNALAAVFILLLAACASSTVTKTGTTSYAPLAPMAEVSIFTAES